MGNKTEMWGTAIMHEVQFLTNDQWHASQEIRHVVFQESFVILPWKPVWKYAGSESIITTNIGPDVDVDFHLPTDADCENFGFHLL
jgi:hypothetical protein